MPTKRPKAKKRSVKITIRKTKKTVKRSEPKAIKLSPTEIDSLRMQILSAFIHVWASQKRTLVAAGQKVKKVINRSPL